jgi:dTDP-D-glucose 4,6-dehydratase
VNIGSEEMVTINRLAGIIMEVAGKEVRIKHVPGPLGVRGRNSDNHLIREKLGWEPSRPLKEGLLKTYAWISRQVEKFGTEQIGSPVGGTVSALSKTVLNQPTSELATAT